MNAPEDLRERMAVIESKMAAVIDETRRTRDRLHEVENDRHAVGLIAQRVDRLSNDIVMVGQKVDRVADGMERIAQRAAQEAARMAIRDWEEERSDSSTKVWANRIAFVVAFLALAGVVIQAIVATGGG